MCVGVTVCEIVFLCVRGYLSCVCVVIVVVSFGGVVDLSFPCRVPGYDKGCEADGGRPSWGEFV
jgi:hypothetical protein